MAKRKRWPETVTGWDILVDGAKWIEFDGTGGEKFALDINRTAIQGILREEDGTAYFKLANGGKEYVVHTKVHPDRERWAAALRRSTLAAEAAKAGDWSTYRSIVGPRRSPCLDQILDALAGQQEEVCL